MSGSKLFKRLSGYLDVKNVCIESTKSRNCIFFWFLSDLWISKVPLQIFNYNGIFIWLENVITKNTILCITIRERYELYKVPHDTSLTFSSMLCVRICPNTWWLIQRWQGWENLCRLKRYRLSLKRNNSSTAVECMLTPWLAIWVDYPSTYKSQVYLFCHICGEMWINIKILVHLGRPCWKTCTDLLFI